MGVKAGPRGSGLPAGLEIRTGKTGESIRLTFVWQGKRRRETLDIPVTPANIKYAAGLRASVKNAIERGTFDYAAFFPNSKFAKKSAPERIHRPTVTELVDGYINTAKKGKTLSPSTTASYSRYANARIKPKWGTRIADEIKTTELRTWIAELVGEMDVKSVRNCVGLLSAVLTRAAADSAIPANPLAPIKLKSVLPKRKKPTDEDVDPFTDVEIAAILAAFKTTEEKALWQFAFSTGMRTGELIAIKWGNIDEIRGIIRVEDNIVSADIGTVEKDTKTGNWRDIPILPGAREAIEAMRPFTRIVGDNIFIHPVTRKRWMDDQQMRKGSWKPALLRAGVRYRYPYQTRHTFASRLLAGGEQELLVAKLLGHATVEMVRRSYGRYISQTDTIVLRGDYSSFGADLGQIEDGKSGLMPVNAKAPKAGNR
jgi:integrase